MLKITQNLKTCQGIILMQLIKRVSTTGSLTSMFHKRVYAAAPPHPLWNLEPLMASEDLNNYSDEIVKRSLKNQGGN